MEKELGADVIKATQASLGKYVKRPPLSEKLLRKPPFRFLHDIVSAVHKTTGFFEGLFEEEELISENVKDRDSKILFLNKVISVISTTTGKSLGVKSTKIVAGQEPDKTNELLQCLAVALDKKLSSDEAVKKYKESVKVPVPSEIKQKEIDSSKTTKKANDAKKLKSKSNEKLTTNKRELGAVNKGNNNTNNESKTKRSDNHVAKSENQTTKAQVKDKSKPVTKASTTIIAESIDLKENQNVTEKEDKHKENNIKNEETDQLIKPINIENSKDNEQTNTSSSNGLVKQSSEQELHGTLNSSYTIGENELNSSLSSQDLMEVENIAKLINVENTTEDTKDQVNLNHNPDKVQESKVLPNKNIATALSRDDSTEFTDRSNELQKSTNNDKVVSISSSRKNSDVVRPPSVRPSSSRPGAPRLREKIDNIIPDNDNLLLAKVNIIVENTNNEEEEDTSLIVEQHTNDASTLENQQNQLQLSSMEHGHLVQQILDSQKEFAQVGKTEIEWQFGAQKLKDAVNQEIEVLRFNIQALSRVANPLGKLLDHIQEDAEVMRQELQQWTKVYDEVSKEMQKQKTANDEALVPLQTRIKQLEIDIQEKRDKIDDLKILVHKNASRIEKLLINGNVQ